MTIKELKEFLNNFNDNIEFNYISYSMARDEITIEFKKEVNNEKDNL